MLTPFGGWVMNRTQRYKLTYVAALLGLAGAVVALYAWTGSIGLLAGLALLMLLPGRIGGYMLRDLFRSRSLLRASQFAEAEAAGEAFLAQLGREPWRRHFIYAFAGIYTWDAAAMAQNNIGAARMQRGELDRAQASLEAALQRDPDYPLPYVNLAVIAHLRGETDEGARLAGIAATKGYSGGVCDALIASTGDAYAALQARTLAVAG
jgi:tetratricopeptide (TPR) repeat protein